jgi:hypothetical protein
MQVQVLDAIKISNPEWRIILDRISRKIEIFLKFATNSLQIDIDLIRYIWKIPSLSHPDTNELSYIVLLTLLSERAFCSKTD